MEITIEELFQVVEACGGLKGFPNRTSIPRVNWLVDCVVEHAVDNNEPFNEYDEKLYIDEVRAGAP